MAFLANLNHYRTARRRVRAADRKKVPDWKGYFDPAPDLTAAVTRLALGAIAGTLFQTQVTTALAAVAVGAAAPALLGQLGEVRSIGNLAELSEVRRK
ncbi:hypothetical protein [Nocardia sp. NPDC052566]|uniref:hypothetical protein n=1 Tax=Nocardia sp. NPDC052566 TaxID=3364330 RepID=UPI0037C73D09